MNILDVKVIKDYIRMCDDGWQQGWHERNGGNLTYRMKDNEVEECRPYFKEKREWVNMGVQANNLKGQYFITTGSGKYFRNVILSPEESIGIVEINEEGDSYRIVWGLLDGARPTSEFPSHFLNHSVKKEAMGDGYRVIYHAHPVNIIAMTFFMPLCDREFTRALWKCISECPVVFPKGVGIVDWMMPGGIDIAIATSELMKKKDAVVWAHHGIFCAGTDFDDTFGLMHTIEKAASIYTTALSCGQGIKKDITDDQIRALEIDFDIEIDKSYLD